MARIIKEEGVLMESIVKLITILVPIIILAFFFSKYIYKVYNNEILINKKIYSQMDAKQYFKAVLIISVCGFIILFAFLIFQKYLPFSNKKVENLNIAQAFNITCSYITNTNWQNYDGENILTNTVQMIGLTTQNFISAGIGISILFALIRGITGRKTKNLGNFWQDLIRIICFILIPTSIIFSILLISTGVPQTFKEIETINTLEGNRQNIKLGPIASQIAIKQLGSNGGGFFGKNSAYPLENPNVFSNYLEMFSIAFLPISLVFFFGKAVKNEKQGRAIFIIMFTLLIIGLLIAIFTENNYQGKETRIGIENSSIWSILSTAMGNGSTNSNLEFYNPVSIAAMITLMGIGEIAFGGVGVGIYTIIGYILVAVFIAGLMIGKTPEYLKKKIEPYEMKMAMILILTTPLCILITTTILCYLPNIVLQISKGTHGFCELLYTAISTGSNNGSRLSGFKANTDIINILLGINMIIARYIPIFAVLNIGQSMGEKEIVSENAGTLKTTDKTFIIFTVMVILILGVLTLVPALMLGPIAEI